MWAWPTVLALLAATRLAPVATPATILLLCYLPGWCVIRAAGLEKRWDRAGRILLSVAVSLAVVPVLLNPVWHFTNDPWLLLGYLWVCLVIGVCAAAWPRRGKLAGQADAAGCLRLFDHRRTGVLAGLLAALVAFATIGPYWPTELLGNPVPSLIHDFVKHHAVLFSLEHRPLPLGSPFYADGATEAVYYYHFFYLVPATVRAVSSGLSIELAFGLHSALVGICTAGIFFLIVKRFTGGDGPASLAALLTTAIGALDIIPLILLRRLTVTLDAWADHVVRIHNFLNQMMWSPQNVLGVLIALVGVYVLSVKGWWRGWFLLGPVLGGALLGSSVWVSMPVLLGLVLLVILEVVSQRRQPQLAARRLAASAGVGLLMLAACAHSLAGYVEMSGRHGKGLTTQWPHQWNALLGHLVPPGVLANWLDLPWVLAVELGPLILFPLLLPRRLWRRAWDDPGLKLLMLAAVAAVCGYTVFRSHFTFNDFGQKTMTVAMAAGLVLASCIMRPRLARPSPLNPLGWRLHEHPSGRPRTVAAWFVGLVLLAGLPMGLYEAPLTAVRRYLPSSGPLALFAHRDQARLADEAAAYRFLRHELPPDAVLQADWSTSRASLVQLARRPLGVMRLQEDTMVFYPPNAASHAVCLEEVSSVLGEAVDARACHETLRRHGITHVFYGQIEKRTWRGTAQFADPDFFEPVFSQGDITVYALK